MLQIWIVKNLKAFKHQINFCSILYKKEKRSTLKTFNLNKITDKKPFWKPVKSLLSDKRINTTKISLVDGNKTLFEDKVVAITLKQYFSYAVISIAIIKISYWLRNSEDLVEILIKNFENHSSVLWIKEYINVNERFQFFKVISGDILQKINNFDYKN